MFRIVRSKWTATAVFLLFALFAAPIYVESELAQQADMPEEMNIRITLYPPGKYKPTYPWGCYATLKVYVEAYNNKIPVTGTVVGTACVWNAWYGTWSASVCADEYPVLNYKLNGYTTQLVHLGGEWPRYRDHRVMVRIGDRFSRVLYATCQR